MEEERGRREGGRPACLSLSKEGGREEGIGAGGEGDVPDQEGYFQDSSFNA